MVIPAKDSADSHFHAKMPIATTRQGGHPFSSLCVTLKREGSKPVKNTIDAVPKLCNHYIVTVITEVTMVRTQIQLTEEQARALKEIAAARGESMAEVIRRAVDGVIRSGIMMPADEKKKRALGVMGKFKSGKRDVSKRHDDYLAEAYDR